MAETRNELSNYREFMEISDRIKRPEAKKKTPKIGCQMPHYLGDQGATPRLLLGRLLQKTPSNRIPGTLEMSRMWSVSSVTRRDTMLTSV